MIKVDFFQKSGLFSCRFPCYKNNKQSLHSSPNTEGKIFSTLPGTTLNKKQNAANANLPQGILYLIGFQTAEHGRT